MASRLTPKLRVRPSSRIRAIPCRASSTPSATSPSGPVSSSAQCRYARPIAPAVREPLGHGEALGHGREPGLGVLPVGQREPEGHQDRDLLGVVPTDARER